MADLASDVAVDRTADLSATDKIGEGMRRALPRLPGEAQGVVLDMLKPENLAIIGATVVVWAASQFFGVGEIVDLILLVVGVGTLGFSVFAGARELYYFVTTAVNATSSSDLDVAAQHFAQAVTILGAAVVQAVLMKGAAGKVSARSRPQVKPRIPDADPPPPGTSNLPPDAPDNVAELEAETRSGSPDQLVRGQNVEAAYLNALGSTGKVPFTPTPEQVDSVAFKVIVGGAKYADSGELVGTIYDGASGKGLAEVKTGSSSLESSYQLRLQTYGSVVKGAPLTIYTSRPVNPTFMNYLTRWGVKVEPLPNLPQ